MQIMKKEKEEAKYYVKGTSRRVMWYIAVSKENSAAVGYRRRDGKKMIR